MGLAISFRGVCGGKWRRRRSGGGYTGDTVSLASTARELGVRAKREMMVGGERNQVNSASRRIDPVVVGTAL